MLPNWVCVRCVLTVYIYIFSFTSKREDMAGSDAEIKTLKKKDRQKKRRKGKYRHVDCKLKKKDRKKWRVETRQSQHRCLDEVLPPITRERVQERSKQTQKKEQEREKQIKRDRARGREASGAPTSSRTAGERSQQLLIMFKAYF